MYKMSVMRYINFFLERLLLYISNHNFCFAPVQFFYQFAVLRRRCDWRISAHADFGQMKLALHGMSLDVCEAVVGPNKSTHNRNHFF